MSWKLDACKMKVGFTTCYSFLFVVSLLAYDDHLNVCLTCDALGITFDMVIPLTFWTISKVDYFLRMLPLTIELAQKL